MSKDKFTQLTNRHIAKLLDSVEEVIHLPEIVKDKIRAEFHYLKQDFLTEVKDNGKTIH
jgi:hypothetical protein